MRWKITSVATIVASLLLAACGSDASTPKEVRVAFVRAVASGPSSPGFEDVLAASGYVLGQNLTYVQKEPFTEVLLTPEEIGNAVTDWIKQGVDLIVAFSSSGADAAAKAAPHTPILFLVNDPVAVGLVTDKSRPDRNLTGVTFRIPADRTLDLARQAVPGLERIGILVPAADPAGPPSRDAVVTAAGALKLTSVVESYTTDADIPRAITALAAQQIDVLVVVNAPTSVRYLSVIQPAAAAAKLPMIANTSLATDAVVVLEPDVNTLLEKLGRQAVRLLNGSQVADVPVEDPTAFRVVLNRTAATRLGLPPFPSTLLRQADAVVG